VAKAIDARAEAVALPQHRDVTEEGSLLGAGGQGHEPKRKGTNRKKAAMSSTEARRR